MIINLYLTDEDMHFWRVVIVSGAALITFLLGFIAYWLIMAAAYLVSVL